MVKILDFEICFKNLVCCLPIPSHKHDQHCVKSVQRRSFFWSVFFCIRTKYLSVFSPNAGKYGPEKTPYLEPFHEVQASVYPIIYLIACPNQYINPANIFFKIVQN